MRVAAVLARSLRLGGGVWLPLQCRRTVASSSPADAGAWSPASSASAAAPHARSVETAARWPQGDDKRRAPQEKQRRATSRQPHPSVAAVVEGEKVEGEYAFPVGRTLRYLRLGRHFYRRHDGQQQRLTELLARCHRYMPRTAAEDEEDEDEERVHGTLLCDAHRSPRPSSRFPRREEGSGLVGAEGIRDGEDVSERLGWTGEDTGALENLEEPRLAEVERFTNYHCHHVKVCFKQLRTTLSAAQRRGGRDKLLSVKETNALLSSLFQASLLLHITALFGVSEQYLESLLAVCLSCSVFLSQQHNSWRHRQTASTRTRHTRHPAARGGVREAARAQAPLAVGATAAASEVTAPQVNSLHWAIVHYGEGVRLWGLMDHSQVLFPMREGRPNMQVFAKLLQAHAGLLLSQLTAGATSTEEALPGRESTVSHAPQSSSSSSLSQARTGHVPHQSMRDTQHYLRQILGGTAAQSHTGAIAHYFGASARTATAAASASALSMQRRCLQLLPMLWLSMLAHHVHCCTGADRGTHEVSTAPLPSLRAARHAFLRVVPLYTPEAPPERMFWATASVLYGVVGREGSSVSHVEVAAMLSAVERCRCCATGRDKTETAASCGATLQWLRCWREAQQARGAFSEGSSAGPRIHSARQLYVALENIPVGCCMCAAAAGAPALRSTALPTSIADDDVIVRYVSGGGLPPLPRRAEADPVRRRTTDADASFQLLLQERKAGLLFINELLFRALLQWRAAQLPTFIRVASPFGSSDASVVLSREDKEEGVRRDASALTLEQKRLVSYTSYLEEITMLLSAALHLRELHARVSACAEPVLSDAARAVRQSVEAAARALAEQMGDSVLPARLHGLAWSRRQQRVQRQQLGESHRVAEAVAVSPTERELLGAIHVALTDVLLLHSSDVSLMGEEEDEEGERDSALAAGCVPERYLTSMRALLPSLPSVSPSCSAASSGEGGQGGGRGVER